MAGCVQASKMFLKLFSYALKDRQQPTNFLFDREWGFLFEKKFKIIKRGHIGKRGILSSIICLAR